MPEWHKDEPDRTWYLPRYRLRPIGRLVPIESVKSLLDVTVDTHAAALQYYLDPPPGAFRYR
jgi:hypothetical protein